MDKNVLQTPSMKPLTPIQAWHSAMSSFKAPENKRDLVEKLGAAGFTKPAVLLRCGDSYRRLSVVNDFTMAAAFMLSWTCQPLKKEVVPQVALCHVDGVILKVYKDLKWFPTEVAKAILRGDPLRQVAAIQKEVEDSAEEWAFLGNEAPEYKRLLGLDLSAELARRGMANPVRYINCHR